MTALPHLHAGEAESTTPRIGDERIVLHTIGGDIVLGLFPDVAPKHVAQLLKLARLGVFDTVNFHRLEPGFVLQIATPDFRTTPMTPEQKGAIAKIPAEFSDIKHDIGILSMARQDGDINSAETSFSILLGPAPHLDHQYTVFGRVEKGMDVVDALTKVPCVKATQPVTRLTVMKAEVVDSKQLTALTLAGPQPILIPDTIETHQGEALVNEGIAGLSAPRRIVLSGLAFVVVIGLLGYLISKSVSPRALLVFNLLHILVAAGMLFFILTAAGNSLARIDPGEDSTELLSEINRSALAGMAGVIVVALLGIILTRAEPKMLMSLNLINVLIAGFLMFALLAPITQSNAPGLAAGLFLGALSIFKLMGQFESA